MSVRTQPIARPYTIWRRIASASRRRARSRRYAERGRLLAGWSCGGSSGCASSVQLEAAEPVGALMLVERFVFLSLAIEKPAADHQAVDLRCHETAVGVFDRVDDRLAAHVERGVDHHSAAGLVAKPLQQAVQE